MSARTVTNRNSKSGQAVAKQAVNRFHQRYWHDRIYCKTYTRGGMRCEINEYSVRLQHQGRREAFTLGTFNRDVAAAKAKEVNTCLEANGWDITLAKYKPGPKDRPEACTVGEFLKEIEERSHLSPFTVRRYAVKLRKIVADIAKVDSGLRGKALRRKFDHITGGYLEWRTKVDGQSLAVLTPDSITAWRNQYIKRAGTDKKAAKSAARSAASCMRCTRALFASDVVSTLRLKLPPYPFAGVKLEDPGPQRYHSTIDPRWLLGCAERELAAEPQQYLAFSLCLWGGLRRKEADLLMWEQVDLASGEIHIRRTAHFEPKTEESQRVIDLPSAAVEVLRKFKEGNQSEFVMQGLDPDPSATYDYYRADHTWRGLIRWLKEKGVRDVKAVHMLRKESGSLINEHFGIEAARQHLGHRDITTTSAHYLGKKGRREVSLAVPQGNDLKAVEGGT